MDPIELIAVAGGILLAGFIFWSLTSVIRFWVNKRYEFKQNKNVDVQKLREFEAFKRKTERRLQNLEAVFVEDEDIDSQEFAGKSGKGKKLRQPDASIEIEDEDQREEASEAEKKSSGRSRSSSGKLPNMLEQ